MERCKHGIRYPHPCRDCEDAVDGETAATWVLTELARLRAENERLREAITDSDEAGARKMISAEISIDHQHGPIVTVTTNDGDRISVYLLHETGTVTKPDGTGYGIEVKGAWHQFRVYFHEPGKPEMEGNRQPGA